MKKESITRMLFGTILVLIGFGFLLQAINVWDFGSVLGDWWPLIIIAVGLLSFVNDPKNLLWPLTVVAVGVLLQLNQLEILDVNVWQLIWPAILIVFGISILFKRQGENTMKREQTNENELDLFTAFSGIERSVGSQNFKGGRTSVLFGGIELDLSEAEFEEDVEMSILCLFGGVELRVPENVDVQMDILPLFGGGEDKTKHPAEKKATLRLNGTAMFGGVEVKN